MCGLEMRKETLSYVYLTVNKEIRVGSCILTVHSEMRVRGVSDCSQEIRVVHVLL